MCFLVYVFGASGQFNVIFPLIELRLPPENSSAGLTIAVCIGTMFSSVSPVIGFLPFPLGMLVPSILAASNFVICFCLDEPGEYLPRAVKLSHNVTLLKLDNVN